MTMQHLNVISRRSTPEIDSFSIKTSFSKFYKQGGKHKLMHAHFSSKTMLTCYALQVVPDLLMFLYTYCKTGNFSSNYN